METEFLEKPLNKTSKCLLLDTHKDIQMSSSILSISSSLTSPIDSGVQLLDSESDITSLMSMSGAGNDLESSVYNTADADVKQHIVLEKLTPQSKEFLTPNIHSIMTKSDIANQNIALPFDYGVYSSSAPNMDYKIKYDENPENERNSKIDLELSANVDIKPDTNEKPTKKQEQQEKQEQDQQEQQDQQDQQEKQEQQEQQENQENQVNQMHVSVSEEVNESLKIAPEPQPQDEECTEQIVFRRQRKKKSSKDIPKKRVSFHEDILNSTKIDDIHINHGFITHQPDISMSFFNWDSLRKPDVIKGRYSWAAEGDTPYYERNKNEREVKSEIFMNSRYSSTSSSSTGSVDSSSCNSLCDNEHTSEEGAAHKPCQKLPRSSCLKKRSSAKRIDTHIVQENLKKSDTNLLDSKIFGSIKNILNFSTSIPLAERGVPEGQEDVDSSTPKRRSFSLSAENLAKVTDTHQKFGNLNIEFARNNLKLAPSEGFYPINMNVPANVVLCDSNVYEHTGISYSYEYDKFKKSLENQQNQNTQKPKSSSVYQMLLKDLNFFKKKEKEKSENDLKALASDVAPTISCDSSDNDTIFDISETNSKHLTSPKHKVNKVNHYSVQNFKAYDTDSQKILNLKPSTSKSSLINRFLRNVTMKKILDVKLQQKQKILTNRRMGLYMGDVEPDVEICNKLDRELEEEIAEGLQKVSLKQELRYHNNNSVFRLKREVFRDSQEMLVNFYKVHSAYTSKGCAKPLIIFLTNATLYITGFKPDQTFCNVFVLPYIELNTILIGPNGHTVHFANGDKEMQYIITTGCSDITNRLVGQLELIIRKNNNNSNNNINNIKSNDNLPAIRHLTMQEMAQLKYAVCTETTVNKEEEYFHYSVVNIQEANGDIDSTPLGPTKKGPLMFKTANDIRWETGYFILKGGVLYILSSPSNRLPLRAFSLVNGACLGAHRTPYCHRPHTFELLVNSMVLQLAAPDEYVASDWLQVLIQTASGLYNNDTTDIQTCTLLLTSQHILTMRETFPTGNPNTNYKSQALSCANISDLTAFRIPLAEQSWCILEFACREVHETSGDLIIYFTTNTELERFISTLELLWAYNNLNGDSFPMNTIPDNETINKKCDDVYRTLKDAWNPVNLILENGY